MCKIVDRIVRDAFEPPKFDRVVRRTILMVAGNALLILAALAVDGWLRYALVAWIVWRIAILGLLGVAAKATEEKQRRLNALPARWLTFLRDGGESPGITSDLRVNLSADASQFDRQMRRARGAW